MHHDKSEANEINDLIDMLFREQYKNLFRLALYILNDRSLAEIAIQETFLIALRFPDKLLECDNQVGWLINTLRNVTKHISRDKSNCIKRMVSLNGIREDQCTYEDKYSEVDWSKVDQDDLIILSEFYLKGFSLNELAKKYGKSVPACKMIIKRAKDRLKNSDL